MLEQSCVVISGEGTECTRRIYERRSVTYPAKLRRPDTKGLERMMRSRFMTVAVALLLATGCAHRRVGYRGEEHSLSVRARSVPHVGATPRGPLARYALVIGNQGYPIGPLASPANDAVAIDESLQRLGFQTQRLLDADRRTMRDALEAFREKLAGSGGVALFYYAGHGLQINNVNYLVPTDADLTTLARVRTDAIRVDDVLAMMSTPKTDTKIVILDACRNDPFPAEDRGGARGLAMMQAPSETFIAYATQPGGVAIDDSPHGIYTGALLKHLDEPGATLSEVHMAASADVHAKSEHMQDPWLATNMTHDMILSPEPRAGGAQLLRLAGSEFALEHYLEAIQLVERAFTNDGDPLSPTERQEGSILREKAEERVTKIHLVVTPSSAMVSIDGSARFSEDGVLKVNPGHHSVRIWDHDRGAVTRSVQLDPGQTERLELTLVPRREVARLTRTGWALGSVGAGALAASLALGLRANAIENHLLDQCGGDRTCSPDVDWRPQKSRGERLAVGSDVLLGVGSASVAGALLVRYWTVLFGDGEQEGLRADATCDGRGCSARAALRF